MSICKHHILLILALMLLFPRVYANTDLLDVKALQDLYSTLNYPPQLTGWRASDGDPCGESWLGVSCSETSVLFVRIHGLGLDGMLGSQLSNLLSLKELDVSSNNISGAIPFGLPPNATHINLAFNQFNQNIPASLVSIKYLSHLNLSHNSLSGPIGNIFTGLTNLKQLDLSHNSFTGDLPISFSTLTNLTGLFLQDNQFTGSVSFLANLPLYELNIQNNHFSGVVPKQFNFIPNLSIQGNLLDGTVVHSPDHQNHSPVDSANHPNERNAPTTKSNTVESFSSPPPTEEHRHKKSSYGLLASIVSAVMAFVACTAVVAAIVIRKHRLERQGTSICETFQVLPPCTVPRVTESQNSFPELATVDSPRLVNLNYIPSARRGRARTLPRTSTSRLGRSLMTARIYSVADLQAATNSFCDESLLGEGSLGSVYKGVFPDGRIVIVRKMNMIPLSLSEEDQFLEAIYYASCLRHPNITTLLGYCMEHGRYLIVYQYVGNLTLEYALHSYEYPRVTLCWTARQRIALGIARALEYLHLTCSPTVLHNNLKAGNVMIDNKFIPYLCDCGLGVLRPLVRVNLKASELPVGCTGYTAPEFGMPGIDKTKCDIYGFGVMLLELLTGRRPFDSSRGREEQSLVKWASTRLHNLDTLEEMVDPEIRGTCTSKALSLFADIITMCIQAEPEFRLPMSDVAESLARLIQRTGYSNQMPMEKKELESTELSFCSANTCF